MRQVYSVLFYFKRLNKRKGFRIEKNNQFLTGKKSACGFEGTHLCCSIRFIRALTSSA
jgi:hypothetical protein